MARTPISQKLPTRGQGSRDDLKKTMRPAFPRDDLKLAFAGRENNGPARRQKDPKNGSSTSVKNRVQKSRAESEKT